MWKWKLEHPSQLFSADNCAYNNSPCCCALYQLWPLNYSSHIKRNEFVATWNEILGFRLVPVGGELPFVYRGHAPCPQFQMHFRKIRLTVFTHLCAFLMIHALWFITLYTMVVWVVGGGDVWHLHSVIRSQWSGWIVNSSLLWLMDAIGEPPTSSLCNRGRLRTQGASVVYTRGPRANPGSSEVKALRTRIYDPWHPPSPASCLSTASKCQQGFQRFLCEGEMSLQWIFRNSETLRVMSALWEDTLPDAIVWPRDL